MCDDAMDIVHDSNPNEILKDITEEEKTTLAYLACSYLYDGYWDLYPQTVPLLLSNPPVIPPAMWEEYAFDLASELICIRGECKHKEPVDPITQRDYLSAYVNWTLFDRVAKHIAGLMAFRPEGQDWFMSGQTFFQDTELEFGYFDNESIYHAAGTVTPDGFTVYPNKENNIGS